MICSGRGRCALLGRGAWMTAHLLAWPADSISDGQSCPCPRILEHGMDPIGTEDRLRGAVVHCDGDAVWAERRIPAPRVDAIVAL